jgi:hypothetical protein
MLFPASIRIGRQFMYLHGVPIFLCLRFLVCLFLWVCACALYPVMLPHYERGTVEFYGQKAEQTDVPFLQQKAPKGKVTLIESLDLSLLYPTVFEFYPKDVLWAIKVNNHQVEAENLPLSQTNHEGRSIDLAPFVHPGQNQLELDMEVFRGDASLSVCVSPWDKYSLLLSALVLLATCGTGAFLCSLFNIRVTIAEAFVLIGGFLLRYIYVQGTPYFMRAYDYWGHAGYLDYVAAHLKLPNSHANWEAFQPPFYYILVGGLTKCFLICNMSEDRRYSLWQGASILCSAGVLIAGFWISRLLYPTETKHRLHLLAVLGVAPAVALNASRASNDVLLNLLEFVWLGFLLQCWQRPTMRTWLGLSVILGFALLTKANALVLIPISFFCLILTPKLPTRSKIYVSLMLVVCVLGIAGWYYLPRVFQETKIDTYIVGNLRILNPKTHINGVFAKSLVFNPFKVLRYPFAEPWGPHHEYFLEVFFKTVFIGEWIRGASYRWMARIFIFAALLLIPAFLVGIYRALRERASHSLPLIITFVAVFAAQWNFVQIAPYIPSQDFRYSVILLVPMAYFFIYGAESLPAKWREVCFLALQFVILNCAIYILKLALET